MKTQRIAYHTLGCKLNFSETSTIARSFAERGYEKQEFHEEADIYVINTCSVTENADKECKQLIRRVKKQNPHSKVVITGCYAQLQPESISAIPGVDLVVGTQDKFKIADHVESLLNTPESKIYSCDIAEVQSFHSAYSLSDRTRTFLKVQDGCDYNCTFCTIPLARGLSRSDTIAGVLNNVAELAQAGVKEVVLTGVNLGDFGKGYSGGRQKDETFYDLVKALDQQALMPRFRISSIEPNLLSDEIIEWVATSAHFMPHFHIPLQSGNDQLLASMRRRYRRELYTQRIEKIKTLMPHACIGVDVIVGYPGETEELFMDTYDYLDALNISYLHVFTYSERADTVAIDLPGRVPVEVRRKRNLMLRTLSERKMAYFAESQKGQIRPVLFEHAEKNGMMQGYSDNYISVSVPYQATYVNHIIPYKI